MVLHQQSTYHPYESLTTPDHSIALPITPLSSPSPPSTSPFYKRTRFRPTLPTLSLLLLHLSLFFWWTHHGQPKLQEADQVLSLAASSDQVTATASCEVCVLNPQDPLCQPYGMNTVRMSRQFEGSGVRVRKALEKALRGEEIGIGILGASVTAGQSYHLIEKLIHGTPFDLVFGFRRSCTSTWTTEVAGEVLR